jgi:hypothetical protein
VGVVAACELLCDRLGALRLEPVAEELSNDLLHVPQRTLRDIGHQQRAVVQPLDRLLADDTDERGGRQVAELRVDRAEHGGPVHHDFVCGKRDERPAGHGVVGDEHRHLPRVGADRVRDLLRGEDQAAGRVQQQVDGGVGRHLPDRPQDCLRVVDVDEAVEGDAEYPDGLLAMDHRDDACAASFLQGGERPSPLGAQRALPEDGSAEQNEDQDEDPDRERGAEIDRARIRTTAASIRAMDGALDWYVLGVVLGLGIAAGAAAAAARRTPAWVALAVAVGILAIVLVLLALPWWAIAAFAAALLVGFLALRRLSAEAIPAAILAATVLAAIPLLGYVAVVVTPIAGARLSRRAESRHAGLRILAKD